MEQYRLEDLRGLMQAQLPLATLTKAARDLGVPDEEIRKAENLTALGRLVAQKTKERMSKACFVAGTLLYTPQGYKAIESFRVGDELFSRAEEDPTSEIAVKRVEEVFVNTGRIWILKVNGRVIHTTSEHPFWVRDKGWVNARELTEGNHLLSHDGQWVVVETIADTHRDETVYNLRIADYHTYFVGSDEWGFSVWAHNACVVKGGLGPPPKGGWKLDTFQWAGAQITGTSASSEEGKTIVELAAGIPNGQIRVTSTEAIVAAGGTIVR